MQCSLMLHSKRLRTMILQSLSLIVLLLPGLSGSSSKLKSCSPWLESIVTSSLHLSDCRHCNADCLAAESLDVVNLRPLLEGQCTRDISPTRNSSSSSFPSDVDNTELEDTRPLLGDKPASEGDKDAGLSTPRNSSTGPPQGVIDELQGFLSSRKIRLENRCQCDKSCVEFGDCCAKSAVLCSHRAPTPEPTLDHERERRASTRNKTRWQCVNPAANLLRRDSTLEQQHSGYYMVTTCAPDWLDSDIAQACQQHEANGNITNVVQVTPVTVGTITYRNGYCAHCNHLTNASIYQYWKPILACNETLVPAFRSQSGNESSAFSQHCQIQAFNLPDVKTVALIRPCMVVETHCLLYNDLHAQTNLSQSEYECLQLGCQEWTENVRVCDRFFKNRFCAVCNGFHLSQIQCTESNIPINPSDTNLPTFTPASIMVMDFTGSGDIVITSDTGTRIIIISRSCPINQVYDMHTQLCRSVTYSTGTLDLVFKVNSTVQGRLLDHEFSKELKTILHHLLRSFLNITTMTMNITAEPDNHILVTVIVLNTREQVNMTTLNLGSFSLQGIKFTHVLSESSFLCPLITLNATEFIRYKNGTVVEKASGFEWNRNEYILLSTGQIKRCSNYSRNYTTTETIVVWDYEDFAVILSSLGCIFNIISCSIVLLTYACYKSLRNLPGLNLMNYVTAILLSNLILMVGAGQVDSTIVCTAMAVLLHFFFFASFTWSSVMAYDLLKTFVLDSGDSHLRTSSTKKTMTKYCVYGWGTPLFICLVCLLLDETSSIEIGYGNESICWISNTLALAIIFGAPIGLILLFNSIVFVLITRAVHVGLKHSVELHGLQGGTRSEEVSASEPKQPSRFMNLKRELIVVFSMFSLLSLTWLFAFLAASKKTRFFWYPFMVFTALQGVFLLFSYILLKKNVRNEYKQSFRRTMNGIKDRGHSHSHDNGRTESTGV